MDCKANRKVPPLPLRSVIACAGVGAKAAAGRKPSSQGQNVEPSDRAEHDKDHGRGRVGDTRQ